MLESIYLWSRNPLAYLTAYGLSMMLATTVAVQILEAPGFNWRRALASIALISWALFSFGSVFARLNQWWP